MQAFRKVCSSTIVILYLEKLKKTGFSLFLLRCTHAQTGLLVWKMAWTWSIGYLGRIILEQAFGRSASTPVS